MVLDCCGTEEEKTPENKKFKLPEEVKEDFGKVANFTLGAICPPAYASKTGITENPMDNWYIKSKKALTRGLGTAVACIVAGGFVDLLVVNTGLNREIQRTEQELSHGNITYVDVENRTVSNNSLFYRGFFPVIRLINPGTYGWQGSHTSFSGSLQGNDLEFKVNGKFPDIVNPEEVSLDDLRQNASYVSVDKDIAFDYLIKE